MDYSLSSWTLRLLLAALLGLSTPVMAEVCAGSPPAVTPAIPQAQFVRAYRYDFTSPVRLAVDAAGSVYVADPERGEVVVRAADGRVLRHQQGLGRPGAIAVDDSNQVYLADLDSGLILVYDSEWQLSHQFGNGEIQRVGDISIDNTGNRIYVSDSESHRVIVFSSAGERLFDFGSEGNGDTQLLYPSGVFFDSLRDEVLVSDQLGYRIQAFSATGDWLYCFGGTSASPGGFFQRGRLLSAPQGLWADSTGRVYVADSFEGQVKVLDRSGRLLTSIGEFGQTGGELRIPSDVVLDPFGRLFVASANNARLEVFGIDAFSDPEQFAPALLEINPAVLNADEGGSISIQFKVPGYHLNAIQTDSIRANGIAPLSVENGDFDNDARQELRVLFDQGAMLNTLPGSGPGKILLSGSLQVLAFEGMAHVEVISTLPPDADQDGVADDIDQCPDTVAGAIVDAGGCALQQYCNCSDSRGNKRYLKCVKKTAKKFLKAGLIDRKQRKQAVKEAKESKCGKRKKHRKHDHDNDDDEDEKDEHERGHDDDHDHDGLDDDKQQHKINKSKRFNMKQEDKS